MKLIKIGPDNKPVNSKCGGGLKKKSIELFIDFMMLLPYRFLDCCVENKNRRIHFIAFNARKKKCLLYGRKSQYGAEMISSTKWNHTKVNMDFVARVLSQILYAESRGYEPVVKIRKSDNEPLMDSMFKPVDSKLKVIHELPSDSNEYDRPEARILLNYEDLQHWSSYYHKWFQFNECTSRYIQEELENLHIRDRRVLGVLCRGTDYTKMKPKFHCVQPAIEDVINLCRIVLNENKYDCIYLATEEKSIYNKFSEEFPSQVLINKRHWYDEEYEKEGITYIDDIKFNDDKDGSKSSLEYISSLYILSNCKSLIAGGCGGTVGAVLMNNMKYEYLYVYDLGKY